MARTLSLGHLLSRVDAMINMKKGGKRGAGGLRGTTGGGEGGMGSKRNFAQRFNWKL